MEKRMEKENKSSQIYYLPILKFKKGDLKALEYSKEARIIPLFEIQDDINENHFNLLPEEFFYDADDSETLTEFEDLLRKKFKNKNGISVARNYEDIKDISLFRIEIKNVDINKLITTFSQCDKDFSKSSLLIDFADVRGIPIAFIDFIISSLNKICEKKWKNIFVSGTSTPKSMSDVEKGMSLIPRNEWTCLYKRFKEKFENINYSDYGIHHPEALIGFDPITMSVSAKIRYTLEDEFLIHKGKSIKTYGSEQYHELARKIVDSGYYMGENFSFGDGYIKKCSEEKVTGNLTSWIIADLSHHFAVVAKQLSL